MSVSLTKIIFDPSRLKTPNIKDVASSSSEQKCDSTPNPPILMDEYGQTPDHYYLARKPPTFFQVKRKLDLQAFHAAEESMDVRKTRRRRKANTTVAKSRARNAPEKPRYDTSLGQLTKKFLKLLCDASDGVINLNTACTVLAVPKRRLYDITNVLEGAGLIQKTSRNNIQWKGLEGPFSSVAKFELEKEIDILEAKENKLDELIYNMKVELSALKENEEDYLYLTGNDIKEIDDLKKKTTVAINISPGGQMVETFERKMVLTSTSSEIDAFLVTQEVKSLTNILHPCAEFKENKYNVQISKNCIVGDFSGIESLIAGPSYGMHLGSIDGGSSYSRMCSGITWTEGDMVIKNAFITEEDDIAPMGRNFLLQTEDQDLDSYPYHDLEPPLDTYSFSLDDGEGLTDLFDCNFSCP